VFLDGICEGCQAGAEIVEWFCGLGTRLPCRYGDWSPFLTRNPSRASEISADQRRGRFAFNSDHSAFLWFDKEARGAANLICQYPPVSFHAKCGTKEEVDAIWERLSYGGKTFMPLDSYPFSER
jgi:hypothetical protein